MKKISLIIIALLVASLCLSACGDTAPAETTPAETTVDSQYKEYPEIDYMSLDLSEYLTLGQYKELTISVPKKPTVTDSDVAAKIADDLIYNGYTVKITDRAVTKSDTVKISYKGLLNGVAFSGGTGEKDNFTIYDGGGFIDGFADGLIGAMPGVEVDLNLTFPENYHSAAMAGKSVVFKVTVHHIYGGAAELTDEIASTMTGGDYKTASELTEYYRERLTKENDTEYRNTCADLVWSRIFNGVTNINIPEKMINDLYNYQLYWAQYYANIYGVSLDTFLSSNGDTRESLLSDTKQSIMTNMVVYSIIKAEGITLSDADYAGFITESGKTEAEWLKSYTKEELTDMFLYTKAFYGAIDWQTFKEAEAS